MPYLHGSARWPGKCSLGRSWSLWRPLPFQYLVINLSVTSGCDIFVLGPQLIFLSLYHVSLLGFCNYGFFFFSFYPGWHLDPYKRTPYPFPSSSPTWGPQQLEAGQGRRRAELMLWVWWVSGGGWTGMCLSIELPLTSTVSSMLFSPHFSNQDIQQTHKKTKLIAWIFSDLEY